MSKAKLEFYRFELVHKKNDFTTFREFAVSELRASPSIKDDKLTEGFLKYFIKCLAGDFSKDDKLKKQIGLVKKRAVNIHIDRQPKFQSENFIIHGVINGGPYGRDRIVSNIEDLEDSEKLGRTKAVLQYFYFLLYLPPDHNEGCFIIHSNGADESITRVFRNFIGNIFKGDNYNKAQCNPFCPASFQDEYKKGANIKNVVFKQTYVENTHSTDAFKNDLNSYDIRIEASPKNPNIRISEISKVLEFFSKKIFGSPNNTKRLNDFETTNFLTENPVDKSTKTFEWNTKDSEFVPVVYLKGRIAKEYDDGTPDFEELEKLCLNYFIDEVLPEIRPDLNAKRTK